jgi:hypothetical protein
VDEFREWQAYYALEPWGEDWRQAGLLAAVLCNVLGSRAEGEPAAEPADFMPAAHREARKRIGTMSEAEIRERKLAEFKRLWRELNAKRI